MSRVSRRAVLKGGALATTTLAVPAGAAVLRQSGLVVFDSHIAESRAFAAAAGHLPALDIAEEHRTRFAALRAGVPRGKTVEGLTLWSDWVALRSELETQGWRLVAEARTGRRQDLFRWTMRRA